MSSDLIVRGNNLNFNGKNYACAIGENGFSPAKTEGDNCTPLGKFALREVLYRTDKIPPPTSGLKTIPIAKDDGWCDAPQDKNYNRKVKLPYQASHEKLWRDDELYDLVVPLGYNDAPVIPGKGSAIFLHLAKPGYLNTQGCIALKLEDLLEILKSVSRETKIIING